MRRRCAAYHDVCTLGDMTPWDTAYGPRVHRPTRNVHVHVIWLYMQDGFGWTNGVALWLLDRYAQSFERALREDGEHDDSAKK